MNGNKANSQEFLKLDSTEAKARGMEAFRKRIPNLTLMDDYYLMMYAQRFPEDFSMILTEFIGKPVHLDEPTFRTQDAIYSMDGSRDVRFDISAFTQNGEHVVLEVESRKKFSELRLRYYIAKQDSRMLEKGNDYTDLPDAYTVVVARQDIRGKDKPRYFIRTCYVKSLDEAGDDVEIVDDGRYTIYINAAYQNEKDTSLLANLIHDFNCRDPQNMTNETIRQHSSILKNTKEGQDFMTTKIENMITELPLFNGRLLTDKEQEEFREEGREEGRDKAMFTNIYHLCNIGKKAAEISEIWRISIEDAKKYKAYFKEHRSEVLAKYGLKPGGGTPADGGR